jgi:hypothetical protein
MSKFFIGHVPADSRPHLPLYRIKPLQTLTAQVELELEPLQNYAFLIHAHNSQGTVAFLDIKISCPPGQSTVMESTPIIVTAAKRTSLFGTNRLSIKDKSEFVMHSSMHVSVYSQSIKNTVISINLGLPQSTTTC